MATANPTRTAAPATTETTRTETGMSLARGPALVLGTILLAAGLYFMYKAHTFPRFSNFPNGTAPRDGNFFFGIFGANGWTGLFTAVAGGVLLFGAAHHVLAKTMSLIVGCALGAAAVIAVISGNVLGMAAANGWTELLWAVCAVILLFNTLSPRRRRTVVVHEEAPARRGYAEPVAPAAGTATTEPTARGAAAPADPAMAGERPVAGEGPMTGERPIAGEGTTAGERPTTAGEGEPLVTREGETAVQPAAGEPGTEQTRPLRRA